MLRSRYQTLREEIDWIDRYQGREQTLETGDPGLLPIAVAYLVLLEVNGQLAFGRADPLLIVLLISTGIVTAVPLLWFGYAARHLPLTTVGFLQYLSPTGTFFLGVFAYHEPFTRAHLITFSLIWIALAIFSFDILARWRSVRRQPATKIALPVVR